MRRQLGLALLLVPATLAVVQPLLPSAPAQAGRLEQAQAARERLTGEEQRVLLDLFALDTQVARGEARVGALEQRADALAAEEAAGKHRLELARGAEAEAQRRLAEHVTALYVEGTPDPLEILLGAASLDELLSGVDGLERLAREDERVIAQVRETAASLEQALAEVARARRDLDAALAAARSARDALLQARNEQGAYLASVRRESTVAQSTLDRLTAEAARSGQRAAELGAQQEASRSAPSEAATGVPLPPTTGRTRTLTVDAVAYSLPGFTASGLPVGRGVVAVDPTVIPLGTRLYVPGYGPAVAADVGTAIKGAIIDLWFPTYEQAAAWGRRTVTITIYGA